MQTVVDEVRSFIADSLGWDGSADHLTNDLPLIQAGILDSVGILSLVEFLEAKYHITVEDGDIISSHLGSLASIAQFVKSKRSRELILSLFWLSRSAPARDGHRHDVGKTVKPELTHDPTLTILQGADLRVRWLPGLNLRTNSVV